MARFELGELLHEAARLLVETHRILLLHVIGEGAVRLRYPRRKLVGLLIEKVALCAQALAALFPGALDVGRGVLVGDEGRFGGNGPLGRNLDRVDLAPGGSRLHAPSEKKSREGGPRSALTRRRGKNVERLAGPGVGSHRVETDGHLLGEGL